eukprot:12525791-Heterocapsa_arctica.AAC.1
MYLTPNLNGICTSAAGVAVLRKTTKHKQGSILACCVPWLARCVPWLAAYLGLRTLACRAVRWLAAYLGLLRT